MAESINLQEKLSNGEEQPSLKNTPVLNRVSTLKFEFGAFRDKGIERVGELNPYLTLACDLRCKYCYMFDFLVKSKDETQLMSLEFLLSMVDFFCEMGNGLDRMTLLGGEPTLHPQITEIVNAIASMPIQERRMTTNGIGLHELKLEKLQPNVFDHVSISIDGVDSSVNNCTRGKGSFNKIMETIKRYKEAGIKLSVNYTVTKHNIGTLKQVASFFAEKGISIVNFHRASLDGNAYNHKDLLVRPVDWVMARDELLHDLNINGLNYRGLTVRIPYIFLTPEQIIQLGYKPIQKQNYHSPDGGYRLIVFPATSKGQGLCYMSSDLIGQPHAELGHVTPDGIFVWNEAEANEMTAYMRSLSPNVSTDIKGQQDEEIDVENNLVRVSHSFKMVVKC